MVFVVFWKRLPGRGKPLHFDTHLIDSNLGALKRIFGWHPLLYLLWGILHVSVRLKERSLTLGWVVSPFCTIRAHQCPFLDDLACSPVVQYYFLELGDLGATVGAELILPNFRPSPTQRWPQTNCIALYWGYNMTESRNRLWKTMFHLVCLV